MRPVKTKTYDPLGVNLVVLGPPGYSTVPTWSPTRSANCSSSRARSHGPTIFVQHFAVA